MRVRVRWTGLVCGLVAALLAAWVAGCTENSASQGRSDGGYTPPPGHEPTPDEVARMLEPNVLGVSCLYDPLSPWLWNSEHTRVCGVKINALYLQGAKYTGVFGDGVIRPRLLVAGRDEQGKVEYRLIKEWTFDVQQAMPFRAKKQTRAGWGYALFLNWGELDLGGRSVRLIVDFQRSDGIVISGSKKDFRVPKPGGSV